MLSADLFGAGAQMGKVAELSPCAAPTRRKEVFRTKQRGRQARPSHRTIAPRRRLWDLGPTPSVAQWTLTQRSPHTRATDRGVH